MIVIDEVSGADTYRLKVTEGLNAPVYLNRSVSNFKLTNLAGGAKYNAVYKVEVAVKINGVFGSFGALCTITTPSSAPVSKIVASQCGTNLAALNTPIFADPVPGVGGFKFEVNDGSTVRTYISMTNSFNLTQLVGGAIYNKTYAIRAVKNPSNLGVFGAYGISCNVTTPAAPASKQFNEEDDAVSTTVIAYPNPYKEDFNLFIKTTDEQAIVLEIYDITGRLLSSKNTSAADINNTVLGTGYSSGIYTIIIKQGDYSKTIKIIKD